MIKSNFKNVLIRVQLVYNVVLLSAVEQNESVIYIHITTFLDYYYKFFLFFERTARSLVAHKGVIMKWLIFVMVTIIAFLLVICYALMVMAHDADERAEKFYKEWKEKDDE